MTTTRRRWLLGALALTLPVRATWGQTARVPTVTRLVKIFIDLEAQLAQAARQHDTATLQRLLAPDFEMRVAREPGRPTAREEWLAAIAQQPPGEWEIEQMAAHDHGRVVDVSFLLRPAASNAGAPLFVVDTWTREGEAWRLQVRYAAPLGAAETRVPGESTAAPLPKKY